MKRLINFLIWISLIPATLAHAETLAEYPDLPPTQMVTESLAGAPSVLAAQAGIKLEQANQTKLQAGPYEYNLRLGSQRRSIDPGERFHEWDVGIERPLRLPNKSAIDQKLGKQGVSRAKFALGDAMHEAARSLLSLWFVWAKESAQVTQWQGQVDILKQQTQIVQKRVRAGDVAKLEIGLAEAAQAQAENALQQAKLREQLALNDLTQRFPDIKTPQKPVLLTPMPLQQTQEYWREQVLDHNHELGLVRAEAGYWQLQAQRAHADKSPDPTVGVRYASERSGAEHIVGVNLSIPLPGQARRANAAGATAHVDIAEQKIAEVVRKLNADAANNYASAAAAYTGWQGAQAVAERMQSNAALISRAYALGEMGLPEVMLARRLAIEANLAATLAQLDAQQTRYRLLLDAHQLWPLDVEDEDEGEHAHY